MEKKLKYDFSGWATRNDLVCSDGRTIFVNLSDYTVGSTKGGEITRFNQFDIDFNQEKYLIETRLSGALTRLWSAIALEEPVKASSGQTEDTGHEGI